MLTPFQIYKKFIKDILANPNGWQNDLFISNNIVPLKFVSGYYTKKFPLKSLQAFRGILLADSHTSVIVKPLKGRGYSSFSSDINVALSFADPKNPLSLFLSLQGKRNGYLGMKVPKSEEILFHWKWGVEIGFYKGAYADFLDQKEIILYTTNTSLEYVGI